MESIVAEHAGHISLRAGWVPLPEKTQIRECMQRVLMEWNDDGKRIVHYGIDGDVVTINGRLLLASDIEMIIDHYTRIRDTIIRHIYDLEHILAELLEECGETG